MDDFASAAMLRLLLRGMLARGVAPPLALPDGARVPLAHKLDLVQAIVRAGGLRLLLELAQGVAHIEGEPLYQALAGADGPHDLLVRWQRLERYVHASHRVRALSLSVSVSVSPQTLVLEHGPRTPGNPAPSAGESLAVLGVWIGTLKLMGVDGLRVEIDGLAVQQARVDEDRLRALASVDRLRVWHLHWVQAAPRGMGAAAPSVESDAAEEHWPWGEPARALGRWLMADVSVTPRLQAAAASQGLSPRTLQRQLARLGTSYGDLVGEVRVRRAAAWLARSGHSLAEIGYLCGYADQSHFTREFTRRAGLPPAQYRQAVAAAPGAPGANPRHHTPRYCSSN